MATAVAYAMSDYRTINLPEGKGCGKEHAVTEDGDGRRRIECDICAPYAIGHLHGWAATPAGVPLTPDEQGEVEIAEREGQVSMRMAMKAMGDSVAQMVKGQQPAQQAVTAGDLVKQLAALSPAERAEIATLLRSDEPEARPEPAPKAPAAPKAPTAPKAPARPATAARRPARGH